MVVIKFHFEEEIRRVSVDEENLSFQGINRLAQSLFTQLPPFFTLKYKDDEGDLISLSSERELEEAFRLARGQQIIRFFIFSSSKSTVPLQQSSSSQSQSTPSQTRSPSDFFQVLEKLVIDNPIVQNLVNNLEIEVKSVPETIEKTFKDFMSEIIDINRNDINNNSSSSSPVSKDNEVQKPRHFAMCDSCKKDIYGIRYKCRQCADYDLCEECQPRRLEVHDSQHSFEEITDPTPRCYFRRPQFEQQTRHCWRRGRQEDVPQSKVVHWACCDNCQDRIVGIRYKCTICPDFDLCESCEARKVHSSDHPLTQILRPRCPRAQRFNNTPDSIVPPVVQETPSAPIQTQDPIHTQDAIEIEEPVPQVTPEPVITQEEKKEEIVEESVQVPTKTISPFEEKLNQLEEMGFTNRQNNIALLVMNKGDMMQVVRQILDC